ncbi:sulfite exporter TauE/SafE family protein [Robiginitalea marina]|uniref:Probable membrane transporter protein n=1 Tax=Robiginitalea marina TaxID=2954105 RepID=A0ABT1AXF7_9FLAO|nr:sulfite exporter TauE/SafE family protein [Robiginitalea marina]MCO5724302.1 sulfite exporter TauE/SafE family protein [Robiginitalea marina]
MAETTFIAELVAGVNPWHLAALFLLGVIAFVFSTLAGGGGALLMLPVLNAFLGAGATAPVANLGNFIGRPARLLLYWKHIQWKLCAYYAFPAMAGAWVGSWVFGTMQLPWLQLLIGLFLVSALFQFRFGQRERSFEMPAPWFAPLGFVTAILGTLVGAIGPVLNPFYLNAGLQKESLIATKTANSFFTGLAQVGAYTFFGILSGPYWAYGLVLGLGAVVGNILGKQFLGRISSQGFRLLLLLFMVLSGLMISYAALGQLLGRS